MCCKRWCDEEIQVLRCSVDLSDSLYTSIYRVCRPRYTPGIDPYYGTWWPISGWRCRPEVWKTSRAAPTAGRDVFRSIVYILSRARKKGNWDRQIWGQHPFWHPFGEVSDHYIWESMCNYLLQHLIIVYSPLRNAEDDAVCISTHKHSRWRSEHDQKGVRSGLQHLKYTLFLHPFWDRFTQYFVKHGFPEWRCTRVVWRVQ